MYYNVPVGSGQVLGSAPIRDVAMAKNANILAVLINVTSGVMLQAFRVSINGLVAIPVNGQRTIPGGVVSVSPNGTYIISSNTVGNTPRFEIWRYNTSTNQYDKHSTGPTVNNSYVLNAFEWMSETTVIASMIETSGNLFGGILTIDIVGNSSSVIFNPAGDVNNRGYSVMSSEDKTRVFFGILTGNTLSARAWTWNAASKSMTLTQTINGGYQFGDNRNDVIVGTRPSNVTGGPRVDSYKYVTSLAALQQNIVSGDDIPRFLANDDIVFNSDTGVRFFRVEPDGTITTQIPTPAGLEGMEAITSKWRWSKFNTPGMIAAANQSTKELKVFVSTLNTDLFAAAPMPDAFFRGQRHTEATLFAAAPMPDAFINASAASVRLEALAPMPTAFADFQTHKTLTLLAGAPMPDAFIETWELSAEFVAVAPMPYAFFNATDVTLKSIAEAPMPYAYLNLRQDSVTLLATAPMPSAEISTTEQQTNFEALAPMPDAFIEAVEMGNVTFEGLAPFPDAFIDVKHTLFADLVAFAPMPDAFIETKEEQGSRVMFFVLRKG